MRDKCAFSSFSARFRGDVKIFSNTPLRSRGIFCYTMHSFARNGDAIFENRKLEIKENYNVYRD